MTRLHWHVLRVIVCGLCVLPLPRLSAQNSPDPLRAAMAQHIDAAKQGTVAIVGLLTPGGASFAVHGRISVDGPAAAQDTIFEIGSLTKVFTSFLLADMVERGELSLTDPVQQFMPASVRVPARGTREITLQDLAMHASGLPRDSVSVDLTSEISPYAGYTHDKLYAFLGTYQLTRDPGETIEYSNIGFALLGHALERRAGVKYEELIRRRVFEPLRMTSSAFAFGDEHRDRRAIGHNTTLKPLPPYDFGIVTPTGGILSTAPDLLKFAAAAVDANSPMKASFTRMTSVRRPLGNPRQEQALGWGMFRLNNNQMLQHNGGTLGFMSRFIVDTTRQRAVIAWINGRAAEDLTDIVGLALNRDSIQ